MSDAPSPIPRVGSLIQSGRAAAPGLLAAVTVAAAARFLAEHYGGPGMLFALLLGIAFHFLHEEGPARAGIEVAAKHVLRWGVALLGLRIGLDAVTGLGLWPILTLAAAVVATILSGLVLARLLRLDLRFGVLTGGAVAICGASAALALSALLPKTPDGERHTLFAVIGVTSLSTIAMVLYPLITAALGLSPTETGLFLGATIHDVAQVVGAGYSVSMEAGDVATLTKLMRVAMLLPVAVAVGLVVRVVWTARQNGLDDDEETRTPALLPMFLVVFAGLFALNSAGFVPAKVSDAATEASRLFLLAAIAAIGMKTSLKELFAMGARPIALIVGETVFLAALVAIALIYGELLMPH